MGVVRNGIESARLPGHATQQPFCPQKYTPDYAEPLYGLNHIGRTARSVNTYVGRKRRNALLVKIHKPQKHPAERKNVFDNALRPLFHLS